MNNSKSTNESIFEQSRMMLETRGMVVCSGGKVTTGPENCGGPWGEGKWFGSGRTSAVSSGVRRNETAQLARRRAVCDKGHICKGARVTSLPKTLSSQQSLPILINSFSTSTVSI